MTGLDGDVNYSRAYRISDQDFFFYGEDNRSSKKIYGTRVTNLESQFENGLQLSYGDNSSSETDFSLPIFTRDNSYLYIATFDGSSAPKFIRINKVDDQLNNIWDNSGVSFLLFLTCVKQNWLPLIMELDVFGQRVEDSTMIFITSA